MLISIEAGEDAVEEGRGVIGGFEIAVEFEELGEKW